MEKSLIKVAHNHLNKIPHDTCLHIYDFFSVRSALPRKRAKPAKIQKERKWKVQDTPEKVAAI